MIDDLTQYRSEFPITEHYAFMNHAGVSPLNRRITAAVHGYLEHAMVTPTAELITNLLAMIEGLKDHLVQFINARGSDELVLMPNTAAGLNTAAVSLPLRQGDNVLVLDGDYPANIYPWQNLAYKGVLTKVVPQRHGGLDVNVLEQRIDRRTRVIALSTVMFASGFRNDIATVGQICKDRGIYFVVDGIQSLGLFPMDVQDYNIDVLACGSQKWMLAAPGSGYLFVRRELLDDLIPGAYVGAGSVVDPQNYLDYNLTFPRAAQRFNLGTMNFAGAVALKAAVELICEVGVERIARHVGTLVEALISDLSERGYEMAASTAPDRRSGIVVARMDEPELACNRLLEAGIVSTVRGAGLRFAPHFYNTMEEVMRVGEVLGDAPARRAA